MFKGLYQVDAISKHPLLCEFDMPIKEYVSESNKGTSKERNIFDFLHCPFKQPEKLPIWPIWLHLIEHFSSTIIRTI